ncbi:lanthionine synthetase C family protein [Streptomyces sp. C36]|uniref:lanthionine synthetase C family protein n=1 Tax=Streptomyces sp. C36 TaxID=3237122 RepID=UPI0034C66E36
MSAHPAFSLACSISDRLAHPDDAPSGPSSTGWWRQSLAHGVPGIALLHIELAAADLRSWQRVHNWLAAAAQAPVTGGPDSHPYYGAPALAHVLALAAEHRPGAYDRALRSLDRQILADVHRRVAAAYRRIDRGELPALAEFDTIRGLTGYGAYLLRRDPDGDSIRSIIEYLVCLAQPVSTREGPLPGWWTLSGPSGRGDEQFPGGHANLGVAHGIAGPLSLLALAALRGTTVDGQLEAIGSICDSFDLWRTDTGYGPAWPYCVTRSEWRSGRLAPSVPRRPSWCYGTAGLARAQQLAALALADTGRRLAAETALARALADGPQLAATADPSLCHGFAGLAHIAARAADDALPETARELRTLLPALLNAVHPRGADPHRATASLMDAADRGPGLLDGAAGIALAVLAPSATGSPRTAWDACLLLS